MIALGTFGDNLREQPIFHKIYMKLSVKHVIFGIYSTAKGYDPDS
jgi:hypothetical protein